MKEGTSIFASCDGIVVATESKFGRGGAELCFEPRSNFVEIFHESGIFSRYYHLLKGSVCVQIGQHVKAGDLIGRSGASGYCDEPHLHFDVVDLSIYASNITRLSPCTIPP